MSGYQRARDTQCPGGTGKALAPDYRNKALHDRKSIQVPPGAVINN
jgi:hypothetical protein